MKQSVSRQHLYTETRGHHIIYMSERLTHSNFTIYKAWIASFGIKKRDVIAFGAVILGCIVLGFLAVRTPVHKAFHRAQVTHIGVRLGSSKPGAQLHVETETGQALAVATRAFVPNLKKGAVICIREMKDTLWGGTMFQHTLPSNCVGLYTPAP